MVPGLTRFPIFFPTGNGSFAQCLGPTDWPIGMMTPTPRTAVFLVLRQWIEDPPDERLVQLLKSHWRSQWQMAVSEMRWRYEATRSSNWIANLLPLSRNFDPSEAASEIEMLEQARDTLANLALPATPGSARYLLSALPGRPYGEMPAGPTQGVMVTSFGIGNHAVLQDISNASHTVQMRRGDMAFQVAGSSLWITDDIERKIPQVVKNHQEFWKARCRTASTLDSDLRQLNKAQTVEERELTDVDRDITLYLEKPDEMTRETVYARAYERYEREENRTPSDQQRDVIRRRIYAKIRRREGHSKKDQKK